MGSRSPLCLLPRLQPNPLYSSGCQTGHSMPALGHLPLHALLLLLPGPGEREPDPGPASPCWPEMPDFHTDQPPPRLFLSSQAQPTSVPEAVLRHVAGHGPFQHCPLPPACPAGTRPKPSGTPVRQAELWLSRLTPGIASCTLGRTSASYAPQRQDLGSLTWWSHWGQNAGEGGWPEEPLGCQAPPQVPHAHWDFLGCGP